MYRDPHLKLDVLLEAIDRLESVFAVYDKDFRLVYANESARRAWPHFYDGIARGEPHFDAMKKEIRLQFPDLPDAQIEEFTRFSLDVVRPGGKGELQTHDGRTYQTHHEKLGDAGTVGIGVDLTALKSHQQQLKELAKLNELLANNDELTGLSNRRHFSAELEKLITRSREDESPFTLGLLDLDGFKRINDVYGHPVGDDLLKKVAQRLSQTLSETCMLARLGGDEFGFACTETISPKQIRSVMGKLSDVLAEPYCINGDQLRLSASIGVATYPDAADERSLLFKRADFALYHAKHHAKGSSVMFSQEHEERISRQAILDLTFREADWERELYLEFQPIYSFESKEIRAVEALARWNSPRLGVVPPDQFIGIAENAGLITKISRILFRKALKVAREWPPTVRLSFNLSPLEFTSRAHAAALISEIKAAKIDPKRVVLELTENAMIQDTQRVTEILRLFRRHGIRIALDDFGSGFSSLNHLAQMPIDIVKIDRTFLDGLTMKRKNQAMLRGIVRLCHDMSLLTVLEGVETDLQMHSIRSASVDYVQGYLFSRPISEEHISKLVSQNHADFHTVKRTVGSR